MADVVKELETVTSVDGTEIGYWKAGEGPPLVMVHSSIADHTRWDALLAHLVPSVTVHAMDRRGRGASGDSPEYAIEREYEDVAAVVDSVAATADSPVAVYAHSYGGLCAFGAATLTANVEKLMLYEGWPPVDPTPFAPDPGFLEQVETLLEEGARDRATETVLRVAAGMSDEEIEAYRAEPSWDARVDAIHTYPREELAFAETPFDERDARAIDVPTLLLTGSESPDIWQVETVAAALQNARIAVLSGQGHGADVVAPELVAEKLLGFLDVAG